MSVWLNKPSAVHGYLMQMGWWPPMRMKGRNTCILFAEVKWAAVRVRYSERPWCDWEQQFQWLPENVEILKKEVHVKLCVCVCVFLCWVCQIIQNPGCHGWVRELAHNEGDVPQLLPVSNASLNQEWREKLTLLEKKSMLLSRQMWVCVCLCGLSGYVKDFESLVWYLFIIPKEYDTLSDRRTQCLLPQWLWPSLSPCG